MRIVGGEFSGHRLVAPKGRGVRPTGERVKEAIFSAIQGRVQGAQVLDLFAGSGALGIEALSRGAARTVFCDSSERAVEAIRTNLERLRVPESRFLIIHGTADKAIRHVGEKGEKFDIIFVDPPYESVLYEDTMMALSLARVVAPEGIVVVEFSKRIVLSEVFGSLVERKRARYGDTCVAYFECISKGPSAGG